MSVVQFKSFGDVSNYYSTSKRGLKEGLYRGEGGSFILPPSHMAVEDELKRIYKSWNPVLRATIRNETGLRLGSSEAKSSVIVRFVPGIPKPLEDALAGINSELMWRLVLNRGLLGSTSEGLSLVEQEFQELDGLIEERHLLTTISDIQHSAALTRALVEEVDKLELQKRLAAIEEDFLGAYFFRIGEINIYWQAIAIISSHLGLEPGALGLVVIAHELAHAYTHRGSDIDGIRWDTEAFAEADLRIVEGLAQFYTEAVCNKIAQRFPKAIEAYRTLLKSQSTTYSMHAGWGKPDEKAGEKVRAAMIKTRTNGIRDYKTFTDSLSVFERENGHRRVKKAKEEVGNTGPGLFEE